MDQNQQLDGYRYFFPVGWALGIWGVLLWILFPKNLVGYPGLFHPEVMMGGFLLSFVCGFLMTAAPRFTSSFGPSPWEQNGALGLIGFLLISLFVPGKTCFYVADLLIFLFLIQFLTRRFRARKTNPPEAFIFVGFGLMAGTFAILTLLVEEFIMIPTALHAFARVLFLQAYVLSLVVGVGCRLIPALLGWAPLPMAETRLPAKLKVFVALALVFYLSYFLEIFWDLQIANILRAVLFTLIGFNYWSLYKLPQRKDRQAFWLWVSGWCLVFGQWGIGMLPGYRIHFLHVVFIAGLSLMTLMIATRVSLSHGQHDMILEKKSKALLFAAILLILTALTRLTAGFVPSVYQSHLIYASYSWIMALIVWGAVYLPKILGVAKK